MGTIRMTAAQFVDHCFQQAGIQLFDGRPPEHIVTPEDLVEIIDDPEQVARKTRPVMKERHP